MRWTDLPSTSPLRTLEAWRESVLAQGRVEPAGVAAIVARAQAGDAPLVLIDAQAMEVAAHHVGASALERGGLLAGTPVSLDGAVALVHVTRAIPGTEDDATPLSLRLGATVWSRANASLLPGEAVVGWFHSHPGIGAFFSDTDRRTQADFFAQAFSLGWVIDPVRGEHAWFVGARCESVPVQRVVAGRPGA
ncbi:MAG: Mov34/MPN/PAD-1 family protein [Betaproteobacteria bacterium]|jgi:proteasome lid subunit RPN8/RPN11|nr:Mov34/MPN/PAD-1 family protein [Betaproteobacteria bacterium]